MWLRQEFTVQRMSTLGLVMVGIVRVKELCELVEKVSGEDDGEGGNAEVNADELETHGSAQHNGFGQAESGHGHHKGCRGGASGIAFVKENHGNGHNGGTTSVR